MSPHSAAPAPSAAAPPPPAPAAAPQLDDEIPRATMLATMAGIIAAMLLGALDNTIVGTAMPKVIAELHGFEHYAAVTTIYMLASTVVVPIAGKLSDLFGRKPFLLVGVGVFVVGSMLCGQATSMNQLIAFRGLQGIGAGFSQSMAFVTIADLFPPARRGRVSGIMGSVFGLASVVGPSVGGFLTDGPGWRWCFYVNVPIGVIAFAILLFAFPRLSRDGSKRPSIDYLGAVTLILGVVPILLGLSWAGRDYAWTSPTILALLGGGTAVMIAFFFIETRAKEAILPPRLLKNRIVWTSATAATLISMGMFGTALFIPLFIQAVVGTSATKSGAVVTPMMFAMIISSVTAGQLMQRMGRYKVIAIVGVTITAGALFLLSRMTVDTSYSTVLFNMIVLGVGLGATMPVYNLAVQNAVDIKQVGVATSSLQFMRSMGGSLGAAFFGAVLTNRFGPALKEALPAQAAAALPPGMLDKLTNPQSLMNPQFQAQMKSGGAAMMERMAPVLHAVKAALASSLSDVFLMGCVLVTAGIAVTLLMRDAPLRKSNRMPAEVPAA